MENVGIFANVMTRKAIINKGKQFGTIDGVITKSSDIMSLVFKHLKNGTAKKIVDTDETLFYELTTGA